VKLEKAFAQVLREYRTFISLLERGLRQSLLTAIFQPARALDTTATDLMSAVEAKVNARN
jgi:hypothetical protein